VSYECYLASELGAIRCCHVAVDGRHAEKDPLNLMSFHDHTELSLGLLAFCLHNQCVENTSLTH
jgi:hypothetical protein